MVRPAGCDLVTSKGCAREGIHREPVLGGQGLVARLIVGFRRGHVDSCYDMGGARVGWIEDNLSVPIAKAATERLSAYRPRQAEMRRALINRLACGRRRRRKRREQQIDNRGPANDERTHNQDSLPRLGRREKGNMRPSTGSRSRS
jgi:hypothetical protein